MRRILQVDHPIALIAGAVTFVAVAVVHGLTLETVELIAYAGILLLASIVDLRERRIPNGCIIAALAVRVVYLAVALANGWLDMRAIGYYAFSACAIGVALVAMVLVADRVFGRESMGGGDLKLFFVAGLYFGWQQGLAVVLLSCVFGIVVGLLVERPDGKADDEQGLLKRALPFGPPIAAACIVVMIGGGPVFL